MPHVSVPLSVILLVKEIVVSRGKVKFDLDVESKAKTSKGAPDGGNTISLLDRKLINMSVCVVLQRVGAISCSQLMFSFEQSTCQAIMQTHRKMDSRRT